MPDYNFENVAVGRINEVAILTGFPYEEMYGRFAGQKYTGRSNEVAVLTRWPYERSGRINEVVVRRGSLVFCCIIFSGRTFINRSVQNTFKLTILTAHVLSCWDKFQMKIFWKLRWSRRFSNTSRENISEISAMVHAFFYKNQKIWADARRS